jgi:AcrR family transcriptional regulator
VTVEEKRQAMSASTIVRPEAPTGPRAVATRDAILDTAERLFRTMGYQKTTVADIARELGMSPANVYRFFASKLAINEAIAARMLGGLLEMGWQIARAPTPAADRLRAFFRECQARSLSLFFNERKIHEMVEAALIESWPVIQRHVDQMEGALRHIITDGQARGEFAKLEPVGTAALVHSTMVCFVHPTVIEQGCKLRDDLPALAAGMAEFVLRALRPHPGDELKSA